jgi:hypothetical protein
MKQLGNLPITARAMASSTQIRGSESKSVKGAWLTLLLPFIIGCFFYGWAHMPLFFIKPGFPNPLTIILGLVVLAIISRAVWETIRMKRFGDPVLDLNHVPVPLGGTVEGRISLGSGLTTAPDFNVKLQCIRRVLQQSGKNSHWVETILWTGEHTASLLPGGVVQVSMTVPPDQEETNSRDAFNQILWRLTVMAPFRGPAFLEKYEIPVEGRTSAAQKIAEEKARIGEPQPTRKTLFRATLPFLIVGLAIVAGGIYLLSLGIADVAKASASSRWPSVSGRVRNSTPPRGNAIFVSRSDSDFAYTFDVNGSTYTGHTVYPHILWRRTAALKMAEAYPPGSTVTVHYSPGDPANACLVVGLGVGAFQRLVMAFLVLTVGFLFAASAAFAPRDAVITGNSIMFRKGTTGSKVMGYSFVVLIIAGVVLWCVT